MNTVPERLAALRQFMRSCGIDACIIPSDDVHQSEYVSDHFKYREYLSGFSGSAGTLAVSLTGAGLWTDSRYFLQAGQQLAGSGITLFKLKTAGCPTLTDWLLEQGCRNVGLDGEVFAMQTVVDLKKALEVRGCRLQSDFKSYAQVWADRPPLPDHPFFILEERYAGRSCRDKLSAVRAAVREAGADYLPLSSLDDIAWLTNLRGGDIDYNPVSLAYLLLGPDSCMLFAEEAKLGPEVKDYLARYEIGTGPYTALPEYLEHLPVGSRVLVDHNRLNYAVYQHLPSACRVVEATLPTTVMKAVKNETEILGLRQAMVWDGVAYVRFWRWLEAELARGANPDEMALSRKLRTFRLAQEGCRGESFEPIVAYGANAAIVHYEPASQGSAPVAAGNILLIDQGGQYLQGTTDMTRTHNLYVRGAAPRSYLVDYAAVLKGNIALSQAVFPDNTRGCQIDVLARQFLWKNGAQYLHGTGHGVGHFLNVHEGPQSIRMEENPVLLQSGMLLSDEPGIYRAGRYGIRLENMLLVEEKFQTEYGRFLGFEVLTLCPFDRASIAPELYSAEEIAWINAYHRRVEAGLSPWLDEAEKNWLADKTRPIATI